MSNDDETQEKLVAIVEETLAQDVALRAKYGIGDKFRFVRDRLQALLSHLQKSINRTPHHEINDLTVREDEIPIYIYIFNTHGSVLSNWVNMLTPTAILEYSVNRPIYNDKTAILNMIQHKSDPAQHAFITIPIKKSSILNESAVDHLNGKVIKIVERSIEPSRLIAFTHTDNDYQLTEDGQLIKKG